MVEGITANALGKENKISYKKLWSSGLLDKYSNILYDTLYVRARFKTLFNPYSICAGRYGVFVMATMVSKYDADLVNYKTYYIDSEDMFGDPYNFLIASSQEANFYISEDYTVTNLELYLYETGDFKYVDDSGAQKVLPIF
jgi:hypothetical protein